MTTGSSSTDFPDIQVVTVTLSDGEVAVDSTEGLSEEQVLVLLVQAVGIQCDALFEIAFYEDEDEG